MNDIPNPGSAGLHIDQYPVAELPDQIIMLCRSAEALVQDGRLREAEEVYTCVLKAAPHNLGALTFLSLRAYETGRYEESVRLLQAAIRVAPRNLLLHQNLAFARRAQGLPEAALEAIDRAIELAPDSAIPHLNRGSILETLEREQEALLAYGRALRLEPALRMNPAAQPPGIRDLAVRAVSRLTPVRFAVIDRAVQEVETLFGEKIPERARDFLEIFKGVKLPVYEDPLQKPEFLFYPGLKPKPWFERGEFSWIKTFEAAISDIAAEYRDLASGATGAAPAEAYVPKAAQKSPLWQNLAGSLDWESFHLYRSSHPIHGVIQRCPKTFAALRHLPLARGRNHAPEVFFSILKPGTHLPPHHGLSNAKLTIHLGLSIPEQTGIKVGGETRQWREGRTLIFDDSFEHEAWNAGTVPRVVLIADIWNPALSPVEQELVARVIEAHDDFTQEYMA